MRACHQCNTPCNEEHKFCPTCGFPIGAVRPGSGDRMIGRSLGNGYTILESVGAGGMGRVYRAEQTSLGKTLAVKVIHPHLAGDENAVARFYAEARASSRINHPNAVSVVDFGSTDDNLLFLVMEFLRGRDLARVVWEAGQLPWPRAGEIIRQVLAALAEAHEQGVIHRDIKPENILVEPLRTGGDFVKVVDFGLAKIREPRPDEPRDALAGPDKNITLPGLVCGTPDYMAPEQCRGLPPDPRSDLYSSAVVLYYCVTGRLPFDAEQPHQVLLMHVNDPVPDPREFAPELPEHFLQVLLRGLEKDPDHRYQSAIEFADALQSVVAPHRREARGTRLCPKCGATVGASLKFCGECGARVQPSTRQQTDEPVDRKQPRIAVSTTTSGLGHLPFVGRSVELEQVLSVWHASSANVFNVLHLVGDEGAGKHRLMTHAIEAVQQTGGVAVSLGPDPSWAEVAYAPVGRCLRALLRLTASHDPLQWYDERFGADPDPLVRAGFAELFTDPPADHDARPRSEAVVRAIVFAVREAARATERPVLLVFEQMHRIDGASVRVIRALASHAAELPLCLVLTHTSRFFVQDQGAMIHLGGLSRDEARLVVASARPGHNPDEVLAQVPDEVLPLHLEQLLRWHVEGGGAAPERLVDVIAARLERLSMKARRVLQALAVLGEATPARLSAVLNAGGDLSTARMLAERGWIFIDDREPEQNLSIAHPLLREVVDASIANTLRRDLHTACLAAIEGDNAPIEVRAMHMEHTNDRFSTFLLLERIGDRALARGDDTVAAQALRRGLEHARRDFALGDPNAEGAIVIFTRKLGDALVRAGEYAEAEGVLREGIAVATRGTVEWARLEGTLGRALCARGRQTEGLRAIDGAIAVASRNGATGVVSEMLLMRAEMESMARDYRDAVRSLEAADMRIHEAMRVANSGESLQRTRARVLVRLARARRLAELESDRVLTEARALADSLDMGILLAQCAEEDAERAESVGDRRAALRAWSLAAQEARNAGDASFEAACLARARLLNA